MLWLRGRSLHTTRFADRGDASVSDSTVSSYACRPAPSCYVVVFDPTAGFVTGGGWLESPPGAYTADPALTCKATLGFVSK